MREEYVNLYSLERHCLLGIFLYLELYSLFFRITLENTGKWNSRPPEGRRLQHNQYKRAALQISCEFYYKQTMLTD